MQEIVPKNLINLASVCQFSLYIVGGSVRDYLAGYPVGKSADWDICASAPEEELLLAAERCGFKTRAVYRNTGTVKLEDADGVGYEFTRFRSDQYVRGVHVPTQIEFTTDIARDARRRDFCANAVYYDVAKDEYADPLGGIADIKNRTLRTVAPAVKVFGEDGLRLLRLARIAAQTGFSPDDECLAGAKTHAALIRDIAPERVYTELDLLLHADEKHGDKNAPYRGLCILRDTGVLAQILPELALGDGMAQRSDFHDHDVLEHSFRCVRYAPPEIRWAALLHDVGKPFCMERDGNFHAHPEEGERLAHDILNRLKAPKHLTAVTCRLIKLHMRDFDLQTKENKVRREIVENFGVLEELLALRQADYSACKDDLSPAPAVVKWRSTLDRMRSEGVPLSLRDLAVNGRDVQALGVPAEKTAEVLRELHLYTVYDGRKNEKERLLERVQKLYMPKE